MGFLQKTLGFAEDFPGYQDLIRSSAAGLGAIGAHGNPDAVTMLLDIGVPSEDPLRAPVALALGLVALRNTPVLLKVLEGRKDRDQAVSLIGEGFDMLEEDLEEERFFAAGAPHLLGRRPIAHPRARCASISSPSSISEDRRQETGT